MKINIRLHKHNLNTLKKMCLRLYPEFKYIKRRQKTITFKRRWYSTSKRTLQVVDLVLLHIPQAINDLYEEHNQPQIFDSFNDLSDSVEYFGIKVLGEDFIQFLQYQIDNLDMSVSFLEKEYDTIPMLSEEQEPVYVKEKYTTRKLFIDAFDYFFNIIMKVIEEVEPKVKVVYINTESACNSPPIRAPGIAA